MSTYFEQAKEKPLDKWPLYNYLISMTVASESIILGQFSLYIYQRYDATRQPEYTAVWAEIAIMNEDFDGDGLFWTRYY